MEYPSFVAAFILCVILCYSAIIGKFAAVFQQCNYRADEYAKCFFSSLAEEWQKLVFCSACLCVYSLAAAAAPKLWIVAAVDLAFFAGVAIIYRAKSKIRVKAKFTKRFTRIFVVGFLFFFAINACVFYLAKRFDLLAYALPITAISVTLIPLSLIFGAAINYPYDRIKYLLTIRGAKKKLSENKNLKVIFVTGSFGKTTTKRYLYELLKGDYKTVATPKSFNTPIGLCLSIKAINEDTQIFIAEAGARRVGDIKTLCKIVRPDISVVTGIAPQHIETFGAVENIIAEKEEAVKNLKVGGFAVISGETVGGKTIYERAKCDKISVGSGETADVKFRNVKFSAYGSSFDIMCGEKTLEITAPFVGIHNVVDFTLAAAVAIKLGVRAEKIENVAKTLTPPKHRFSVSVSGNGVTIIDDGYNANIEGIKSGAESLKYFGGKKFAVFSGIVEGGTKSYELNSEAGRVLSENCDRLIAVGRLADEILSCAKGERTEDLDGAKEILKKEVRRGDTVAFFSDLPDRY
ncbi:MAG: UDP-N-acetylmuramoyl-tripeptide--D-alanyl-D-alanine ligase [Candidatus Borkfalkiaceae bacterium]|nr:UDP-N-acetylmuramoyl-tripeptide--D-alanyl-D-alanine ligase [Christensenellaceae bacterium]